MCNSKHGTLAIPFLRIGGRENVSLMKVPNIQQQEGADSQDASQEEGEGEEEEDEEESSSEETVEEVLQPLREGLRARVVKYKRKKTKDDEEGCVWRSSLCCEPPYIGSVVFTWKYIYMHV